MCYYGRAVEQDEKTDKKAFASQTSCSFALPIDSSVWKLAHLDTALIITHTSGNGTSKIMLQTEQQATLDNLISRLRQYSQQARLALEATSVLGTWMAQSEYAHQNDSSLDESTTASVEEPSIFDPAFVPFVSLPAQAFSESAPMTYTQQTQSMIVPPHALSTPVTSVPNSHGPAYMAVDQMDGQGPIQELHHELQLEFGEEMDDMAQAWQPDGLAHVAYFAPGVQQTLLPSLSEYDQFNDIVHEAWADWDTLTAQERQAFEPEL